VELQTHAKLVLHNLCKIVTPLDWVVGCEQMALVVGVVSKKKGHGKGV